MTGKFDDQIPLANRQIFHVAMKPTCGAFGHCDEAIQLAIGRSLELCGSVEVSERLIGGVACENVEVRRSIRHRLNLGINVPLPRILRSRHRYVFLVLASRLIGAISLNAAEGRKRFMDQHAVHGKDDGKEAEKTEEHHAPRDFGPRATQLIATVWKAGTAFAVITV